MRVYPRTVWVLTPTFVPKQVEIVSRYKSTVHLDYDVTANGKAYHLSEMHATEAGAIAHGVAQVEKQYKDLEGRKIKIEKRHANLIAACATLLDKEKTQ